MDLGMKEEIIQSLKEIDPDAFEPTCGDLAYESRVKILRSGSRGLHETMDDADVPMVHKIELLLDVANDPCVGEYGYIYTLETVRTAKTYLMGVVRFLRQYDDAENAWKWLDSQFSDCHVSTDEYIRDLFSF